MNFYEMMAKTDHHELMARLSAVPKAEVKGAINKTRLQVDDLIALLSPAAEEYLEEMAQRAREITWQRFGRVILLYAPLYLSDYCENSCPYCSFNVNHRLYRRTMDRQEILREAKAIAEEGIEHILLLTGESRKKAPFSYLRDSIILLKDLFPSISLEVYPLTEEEYRQLCEVGLDGVTIYQEVYDEQIYRKLHVSGPKSDYRWRLQTPERICRAGVRTVNIGALLGLHSWRSEVYWLARHAAWLQEEFPGVEVAVSVPRLKPHLGNFKPPAPVSDRALVQIILALRLFLPWVGITLSTRERAFLREHLLELGVTKMSAGSRTNVGGYTGEKSEPQFEVADDRSVSEIVSMIKSKGYQPIFRDWV